MIKKTRNLEKTRAHIMEVAFLEIFRHGFQSASVNDIVAKTNVTKGAFFHHFPVKNALGYALVDETLKEMTLSRWIRPLAAYRNPIQGILKQLKKVIDETSEDQLVLGCPLNNLIQEMSSVDPVFREKLQAVVLMWIDSIEKYIRKAQEREFVRKDVNPRQVAEFIVMAHEGLFGINKALGSKKVYYSLYEALRTYLKSIGPDK